MLDATVDWLPWLAMLDPGRVLIRPFCIYKLREILTPLFLFSRAYPKETWHGLAYWLNCGQFFSLAFIDSIYHRWSSMGFAHTYVHTLNLLNKITKLVTMGWLPGLACWVLSSAPTRPLSEYYWVPLSTTEYYWVLLSITEYYWVVLPPGLYQYNDLLQRSS